MVSTSFGRTSFSVSGMPSFVEALEPPLVVADVLAPLAFVAAELEAFSPGAEVGTCCCCCCESGLAPAGTEDAPSTAGSAAYSGSAEYNGAANIAAASPASAT